MKICIINNIYPPYDRGGAEQVVVKTVDGLLAAGHDVVVLTSSPKGDECEDYGRLKIYRTKPRNIFYYTNAHTHSAYSRFFWHMFDIFNVSTARWVRTMLSEQRPDVVHTHNLMGLSFLIPRVIRSLGIRHIHNVHDVQLVEPSAMILKAKEFSWRYTGLSTRFYSAVMKRLMGSPHVVISPSQFLQTFYRSRDFFPDSRFIIIRNPVMFDHTGSPEIRPPNRGRSFAFLYLGQIEYHKGVLLLLEAFKQFLKECDFDAHLHIVGDGSLLGAVREQSRGFGNIHIHGRKDRSELTRVFKNADVTVVPSLCYENSPTVIFESFAFGVPVLASNIEGIAELIREGENGLMFAAGDVESLQEKMRWCAEHREALKQMGEKTAESLVGLEEEEYTKKIIALY